MPRRPASVALAEALEARRDHPLPDLHARALALVHGTLARGDEQAARVAIGWARALGVPEDDLAEAALQVVAFAGYPRAIQGLGLLARGRDEPVRLAPDPPDARAAGLDVWRRVYAEASDDVLAMLEGLLPGFPDRVLDDAYGRILARPGLPLGTRELMAVAALALLGLASPLGAHVRGALRNGSDADAVEDILATCRLVADEGSRTAIDQALDRLHRNVDAP